MDGCVAVAVAVAEAEAVAVAVAEINPSTINTSTSHVARILPKPQKMRGVHNFS